MTRQPVCDISGDIVERECSCVDETIYFPVYRMKVVNDYTTFKCVTFRCEALGRVYIVTFILGFVGELKGVSGQCHVPGKAIFPFLFPCQSVFRLRPWCVGVQVDIRVALFAKVAISGDMVSPATGIAFPCC